MIVNQKIILILPISVILFLSSFLYSKYAEGKVASVEYLEPEMGCPNMTKEMIHVEDRLSIRTSVQWAAEALRNPRYLFVEPTDWGGEGKGFNSQKHTYARWVQLAVMHNRTLIVPPFNFNIFKNGKVVDAEDLLAIDEMNERFSPKMGRIFAISEAKINLENLTGNRKSINNMTLLFGETAPVVSLQQIAYTRGMQKEFFKLSEEERFYWRRTIAEVFIGPSNIQKKAKEFIDKIGSEFMCIHSRTEIDFEMMFHSAPGFYTTEEIIDRIRASSRTWPHFRPVIYLAGHIEEEKVKIYNNSGLFTQIWDKHSAFEEPWIGDEGAETNVLLSALDFEVCARAVSFVGNNHSLFSEAVNDRFVLVNKCSECSMQVNDISKTQDVRLTVFCSRWNDTLGIPPVECQYYRLFK